MKILDGGIETLVEDLGRPGYGRRGVAPAGAVDSVALKAANILVGNPLGEAGLEIKLNFEAEFTQNSLIAITGADSIATINNETVPMWQSIAVTKGDRIRFAKFPDRGWVSYLGIAGGLDVPLLWGSKSTCTKEGYGGFKGRKLQAGDNLDLVVSRNDRIKAFEGRRWRKEFIPEFSSKIWKVRATPGPNSAPEFFTREGMELWYSEPFQVDHNSNRGALRLRHPKPLFARDSGGEAGIHPAMVPMQPYRVPGCLNVGGDFGILLFVDGVNAGGYVCALTVILADLWMVGQAVPVRNSLHFIHCTLEEAQQALFDQDSVLSEESLA
jgi:biotin-dependent carboxylase-like uncharacterized protein